MRRVTLALLGAFAGTVVLVGLKTPMLAAPLGYAVATPVGPPADGSEPAPDPAATSSGAPPVAGPATTPGATGPAAIPPSGPSSAPAPPAPPPPAPPAPPASRTITGSAIAAVWEGENFGNMQVRIVVTGSHIDDVITIAQSNRPKTVATELRRQALTAQSANVGNVSGATASSTAYKESLASAIAQI